MERPTFTIEPVTIKNKIWLQIVASLTCLTIVIPAGILLDLPVFASIKQGYDDHTRKDIYIAVQIGHLIGNVAFSTLIDHLGRKTSLLVTAPIFALSSILVGIFPSSLFAFLCSQFLGAFARGGVVILIPVYICEISEPRIRGTVASLYETFFSFGILMTTFVDQVASVRMISLVALPFSIIFFVVFIFMPESPYYLIMKGKTERAAFSLKKLRRNYNVEEEMSTLYDHIKHEGGFRDLIFTSSNRRSIMVMSVIFFLGAFSGEQLIPYIRIAIDAPYLDYVIKMAITLIATAGMDLIGRRILLLVSISGCFFSNLFFAIFFFADSDTKKFKWLLILGLFYLFFSLTVGLKSVAHCLMGELFNVRIKAKAICLVNIFASLCLITSHLLHLLYPPSIFPYGFIVQLLLLAIVQFLGFWFCWKFLPETKRKSLEEIQQELKIN